MERFPCFHLVTGACLLLAAAVVAAAGLSIYQFL